MSRAAYPIVLMTVALLGCAHSSDYYYRAANTEDQESADERSCRNEATQIARARSREDAHLLEDRSSANDYSSGTVFSSDLNINRYEQLATNERESIRDLTRSCMADRGYRLMHD
jgi:hypothetical protein